MEAGDGEEWHAVACVDAGWSCSTIGSPGQPCATREYSSISASSVCGEGSLVAAGSYVMAVRPCPSYSAPNRMFSSPTTQIATPQSPCLPPNSSLITNFCPPCLSSTSSPPHSNSPPTWSV